MINIKAILSAHQKWLQNEEGGRRANLSRANLSRANLSRTDLSHANLSGANLCDANLSRANLSRADLSHANLSRADLFGANLSGANLCSANLCDANLSLADISRANLYYASLCGANLCGAKWDAARTIQFHWQAGPQGSRRDWTFSLLLSDNEEIALTGCFRGTWAQLLAKSAEERGEDSPYHRQYLALYACFRVMAEMRGVA